MAPDDPESSRRVHVSQLSGALVARAAGGSAPSCLWLGLGTVTDRDAAVDGTFAGPADSGNSGGLDIS